MEIRPLTPPTPGPQGLDALGATAARRRDAGGPCPRAHPRPSNPR